MTKKEIAKEECKHIIEGSPVSGWYTCELCGKKFRKAEAEAIISRMSDEAVKAKAEKASAKNSKKSEPKTFVEKDKVIHHHMDGVGEYDDNIISPSKLPKKPGKETHITINCCDCGEERIIKVQDAFQVKRCVACQKIYRAAQRRKTKPVE